MSSPRVGESSRSIRVPLRVTVEAQGAHELLMCDGETIVVNCDGALISTTARLRVGMKIQIHAIQTDKCATAKVVYVDPERPRVCGISIVEPDSIWGLLLPPE